MADLLTLISIALKSQAFLALGLQSLYNAAMGNVQGADTEASREAKGSIDIVLAQLGKIFAQRTISVVVIASSAAAGFFAIIGRVTAWGYEIPIFAFSQGLFFALVVFFSIELFYIFMSKVLRPELRNNVLLRRLVDLSALTGALLFSVSAVTGCLYDFYSLPCQTEINLFDFSAYIFQIVLFLGALGGISIVATISESLVSHAPLKHKPHILYLVGLFSALFGVYFVGRIVPYLGAETVFAGAGLELAFIIGFVYLAYLSIRNRKLEISPRLIYVVLMISLSGLFLAYNTGQIAIPDKNPTSLTFTDALGSFAIPIVLFGIGYTYLILEMPKALERKLGLDQARVIPVFTFLIFFSGLATSQVFFITNGLSSFLGFKEIPVYAGLIVGTVVFTVSNVRRAAQKKSLKMEAIVPFCNDCGVRVEKDSRFCWNCGSKVSSTPEQVLFVGNVDVIATKRARHSRKRKLATAIAGGPIGYLAFGRETVRRREGEGQMVLTDRALYFGGHPYPMNRIVEVNPGHFSNSIILNIKKPSVRVGLDEQNLGRLRGEKLDGLELKTNDIETMSQIIKQAIGPVAAQAG